MLVSVLVGDFVVPRGLAVGLGLLGCWIGCLLCYLYLRCGFAYVDLLLI